MLPHFPLLPMEVEVYTQGVGLPGTPRQRCEFLFPLDLHWCIPARKGQEYLCKHCGLENLGWLLTAVSRWDFWLSVASSDKSQGKTHPSIHPWSIGTVKGRLCYCPLGWKPCLPLGFLWCPSLCTGEVVTGEVSAHLCCHCGNGASFSGVKWLLPKILLSC